MGENFMRRNRQINGAPQPEQTAARDAAEQRAERRLSTQPDFPGTPDDLRFTPQMSTCAAINDAHKAGGISGLGPFTTSYEQHIPYIGKGKGNAVASEDDRRALKTP